MKKRTLSMVVAIMLLFSVVKTPVFAMEDSIDYQKGLTYLNNEGISAKTISLMSEEEISEYSSATHSQHETTYCAFITDRDTGDITVELYTEEEYNNFTTTYSTRAHNSHEYSWMVLELTSTFLSGDDYKILCEYEWLTNPVMRWTDIVSITCDSRILPDEYSGVAKMSYTNSSNLPVTVTYSSAVQYCDGGLYVEFDIPAWGNKNIYGYLSTRAQLNMLTSGTISFNNWAYYAHMTSLFAVDYDISIPSDGGFTITPSGSFDVANVGLLTTYTP